MKVLFFAQAADASGCREEEWEVTDPLSVEQFWAEALRRHPRLAEWRPRCRLACAHEYVAPGEMLDPGQETAVIPPVSGG